MAAALFAVAAVSPAGPAWAQAGSPSQGDRLLLEAHEAFKRSDGRKLQQLLPQLRGHPLEAWAAYWEMRERLERASPAEVQDFLKRYAGTYQEDRLRNDWLELLGERRDWSAFLAEHKLYRMNDDREVACYAVLAHHLRGTPASATAADEVRRHWLAQREADDGCTQAARQLLADQRLRKLDVWHKARIAIENNRAKSATQAVELVDAKAAAAVAEILKSPARFLTNRVVAFTSVRRELITLALVRLAATDLEQAVRLLDNKWGPQLSAEERNWVWGVIGRLAASRLSPDALSHYAQVSRDADLSDDMLAWKVRAALRGAEGPRWDLVRDAIDAMSPTARRDAAWTYWRSKAVMATARSPEHKDEAVRALQGMASMRGFYEQLALEDLGQLVALPAAPQPLSEDEKATARQHPGLNRALYAIALGLRPEGVREWNYVTNLATPGGMSDRELLAAAQLACEREVWDRCINTSERTRGEIDVAQRFPMPFREAVVKRSREINLDPSYVYGLIRQESRFIINARSHVGASGLMQVMPATARWTAKKIGLSSFSADQINDRDTNIAIGTGYLKLVLDDFEGSMAMAAAAYNAGPSRPRQWRAPGGSGPLLDGAIWAENIPFNETRDYVKKVLSNATVYAAILSGQPQSLRARLGKIGPRDQRAPETNKDLP